MASLTVTDQGHRPATSLKLAFCLYKYFPYGGLQRDFLRIALDCQRRGHHIRVYTLQWWGDVPDGFEVVIVPVDAVTNHTRYERFHDWVRQALQIHPVDGVIGINKMPGLDVYYAADSCYEEKAQTQRGWWYRLLPRYRHFSRFERAVFDPLCRTRILMISEAQRPMFEKHYGTPRERVHLLPPGISRDRIAPDNAGEIRSDKRRALGIADDEFMLLMVGSGFIKKGLARTLHALKALPADIRNRTRLFVIGEDNPAPFRRLILRLGLRSRVTLLSGRDDVPEFLLAADILLHPALDEAAGIVLLEAIVAGLPVLATDVCGYGHYVEEAGAGRLLSSPFSQQELNRTLLEMIQSEERETWKQNGLGFARSADIYSLHWRASEVIEDVVTELRASRSPHKTLAFCLFKYFPFGGLQRDFLSIARECLRRGYHVRVYTLTWQGPVPSGFEVITVPVDAITNHTRYRKFSDWVGNHLRENPASLTIGFNKMPGLDIYYAADSCYEEKAQTQRSRLYRMIHRYRCFSSFERAVFDPVAETKILMISEIQKPVFLKYYDTPERRLHLLPPGVSRDRIPPENHVEVRAGLRREFSVSRDDFLLLLVGSGFITKGLDRVLLGMHALPVDIREKTRLIAIGQDAPDSFLRMARRLGLGASVRILKGRSDVPRFLFGADLLVHPAYAENTGTVILEAIVAGLPVLATEVCGYANHVARADAGRIIPSPFRQDRFNEMLCEMICSDQAARWRQNGITYSRIADIYSGPEIAADYIESSIP